MSKIMSDDQLRRRKRLQGTLSTGTGALGIAAGAAAVASRGKFGKHTSKIQSVAKPATLPLTAGSAALGGVGSFNFASIQRQESKKRPLSAKNVQNVYIVRNRRQMRRLRRGMQEPNVTRVTKAEKDRSKTIGYGSTAALAGTAAISRHSIIDEINRQGVKRYDRKINSAISDAKKLDPRNNLPRDRVGRTVYQSPAQKRRYKDAAKGINRRAYSKVAAIKYKRARPLVGRPGRLKLGYGAAAVAIPSAWMAARSSVNKADYRRKDVDAGTVGALAGGLGYQQASYALKPLDRKFERKIAEDNDLKAIARAHQRKYKRPSNAYPGHKSWRPYFRNYPKNLPGGRMKRTLAFTHTGKSGVALTGAAALGAGAVAMEMSRRRRVNRNVSKGYTEAMDFGLSSVHQGRNALIEKSFKAYNPEHKRQRRSETAANIIAPTVSGGAAVGAGVYGVKAGRELKGARGEFRSGLANEAVRAKQVKNMQKTPTATGNYRNLAQANKGYRKVKEAARSAQKVANHPGGAANMERGFKAAKAGARSAGKAGALGLVAVGTGLGAHRLREYQKSGKGQTYRPLYR